MSLSKKRIQDRIEIVGEFKHIQVRYQDQIIEDGKVINETAFRVVVNCGEDNLAIEHNVKGIADLYWSEELKAAFSLSKEI
jgi:hypothetical protein